jgi:serine/threonine-protein phosphatase 4 regulatory subunit 1
MEFAISISDLHIDDTLSELDRVTKYCLSSIGLQRLVHVRLMSGVCISLDESVFCERIVPIFWKLTDDTEAAVREALCGQLSEIIVSKRFDTVLDSVLPLVEKLLGDSEEEVCSSASDAILAFAKVISSDDLEQQVLTIALRLAHEDGSESKRVTATKLLNSLSKYIGLDLCRQFVIPELVSLAEDPVFLVRKSTALNLHVICDVGGEYELLERLMPAFVRLSKDDMFRVRRACAEALPDISKVVSDDIRAGVLIEIFLRLAQDPSKIVRQHILLSSGKFIATLPAEMVSETLLNYFCSTADGPCGDITMDAELIQQCAYSFPAVLCKLGRARWFESPDGGRGAGSGSGLSHANATGTTLGRDSFQSDSERCSSLLKRTYWKLLGSNSIPVKRTLAYSLHEIASILCHSEEPGRPDSETDDLPLPLPERQEHAVENNEKNLIEDELTMVFEIMLQESEVIQMGVIKNIASFVKLLSQPCRSSYLPLLYDIVHNTNPFKWRIRKYIALQLTDLVVLPEPCVLVNTLFPLTMTLMQDPIASVRKSAMDGAAKMLSILYDLDSKTGQEESGSNSPAVVSGGDGAQAQAQTQAQAQAQTQAQAQALRQGQGQGPEGDGGSGSQIEGKTGSIMRYFQLIFNILEKLFEHESSHERCIWAEFVSAIPPSENRSMCESYFASRILKLSIDPVIDVRITIAELLFKWIQPACKDSGNSNSDSSCSPIAWVRKNSDLKASVMNIVNRKDKNSQGRGVPPLGELLSAFDEESSSHDKSEDDQQNENI